MPRRRSDRASYVAEGVQAVALDTSCLIAGVCAWHEHHASTRAEIESLRKAGATLLLPAHALAEAYSVLTRFPQPHRLAPSTAVEILSFNFKSLRTVGLNGAEYWALLETSEADAIRGGRIYDALIAASARKAGAGLLLTWDIADFVAFADAAMRIETPPCS